MDELRAAPHRAGRPDALDVISEFEGRILARDGRRCCSGPRALVMVSGPESLVKDVMKAARKRRMRAQTVSFVL